MFIIQLTWLCSSLRASLAVDSERDISSTRFTKIYGNLIRDINIDNVICIRTLMSPIVES